jgi:heme/copper-type cytochrome/quinol oxidase subunit 2
VGTPTEHVAAATATPLIATVFTVLVVALWWVERRRGDRSTPTGRSTGVKALAVLTALAAVVTLGWVVRAGHSGATAVWSPIVENTTPGQFPVD